MLMVTMTPMAISAPELLMMLLSRIVRQLQKQENTINIGSSAPCLSDCMNTCNNFEQTLERERRGLSNTTGHTQEWGEDMLGGNREPDRKCLKGNN